MTYRFRIIDIILIDQSESSNALNFSKGHLARARKVNHSKEFKSNGSFTLRGKRWISVLRYILYSLRRDRWPLFSIVPVLVLVHVPSPVPCSVSEPLLHPGHNLFYNSVHKQSKPANPIYFVLWDFALITKFGPPRL